ncbi:MAG: penicillin-binding protein 2 [Acidobacteriota bacterium]|jgi:cell division protein FtsI (penicillin-binding protein 3)
MFRLAKNPTPGLVLLLVIPAFLILSSVARSTSAPERVTRTKPELNTDLDHVGLPTGLQAVAAAALGAREGAIVVLDPQTGLIRAVVNSELAFKSAFPPGSTIKAFTALAALRAGVITEDTRIRCRGKYKRVDVIDACVHPPKLPRLNPAEALAYSCNYFFATTGARLDSGTFAQLLHEFGFGRPTGIEGQSESFGVLARSSWQPQSPLGEGPFLQVTPVQLATAYAALFNGGALLKPNHDGVRRVRAQLRIDDKERSMLLDGMRGVVSFGTAEKADLDSLPVYIIGKTGTSTQLGGFRTQGWFVGIAFERDAPPDPENAQLLVIVYLKNAHGSQAARLARPIFEEVCKKLGKEWPIEAIVLKPKEAEFELTSPKGKIGLP